MPNAQQPLSQCAGDPSTAMQPTYYPEEESECYFNNDLNSLIDSDAIRVIYESAFVVDNQNDSRGDDLYNNKRTRIKGNDDISNFNTDADRVRISYAINSSALAAGIASANDQAINPSGANINNINASM